MKNEPSLRNAKRSGSFFPARKTRMIILLLLIGSIATMTLSMGMGDMHIHPLDVVRILLGKGTEDQSLVIYTLRLPRIVVAFMVGASLAAAGAILQGLIRNPLASPDVVGITSGASVAAVFFITCLPDSISIHWLPVAAMLGAGITSLILYMLAWKKGITPMRLVLVGIGINFLMMSVTKVMLVLSPIYAASEAYLWLTGTVYGSSWGNAVSLLPCILIFMPLAFMYAKKVNVLQLGDEIATGLGSSVQRNRFVLLLISVALAGSAVAIAGGISFVGLIAPHMTRKLVGPSFQGVLIISALIGGLMVVLADLIARTTFMPSDIPVGVFTAGIGAPFFIYLLYRNRNTG